jgi:DNA polymerase elongation subunit (family B)
MLDWFKQQSITETKGVFKNLKATVNGFDFVFGLGGIHGSMESVVVESDDEYAIIDLDVTSYYPNLAIVNGFHPEHLGKQFCSIYKHLFEQRKQYPKKSAENAMLKLALNGVYGDSNSEHSVFYDPQFTMSITLNGQLLLCLLAEALFEIEGIQLVQVNTDGLTVRIPRSEKPRLDFASFMWQEQTGLQLEEAFYKRMFIRDCNNYIAEYDE